MLIANKTGDLTMGKLLRTAGELEEELRVRLGPGDYKVTIHQSPALGWHAMIHSNRPAEAERLQPQADTMVTELCQHFELQTE